MRRYKVREILAMLQADGWYQVAHEGSHRQFKHPTKKRTGDIERTSPGHIVTDAAKQHMEAGRMEMTFN